MKTPALLSVALLLLLLLGSVAPTTSCDQTPITIQVANAITHSPNKTYNTQVAFRGILIGALKSLQESSDFTFTYTEDPNHGPLLESVNGLAANHEERTYWELLVMKSKYSSIQELEIGIGCYIPNANEQIILKYNKY